MEIIKEAIKTCRVDKVIVRESDGRRIRVATWNKGDDEEDLGIVKTGMAELLYIHIVTFIFLFFIINK